MCSFLALQTNRLWEMAAFTMCTWMLEFTEPMLNVNLNSSPFYRNPLSRGITVTFHLIRHKVIVQPEGVPTPKSWVCSLLVAAVSLLYTAAATCYWRCCPAVLSHSMSCLAGLLPHFNFCLLELVLLQQPYSGLMPFFLSPFPHPHPLQWENHNKSLQLEAQTYQRIQEKIQERVMNNLGTWIDWQYLQNAAKLLAKVSHCGLFGTEKRTHQNTKFTTPSEEGNLGVVSMWDSTSGLGHELAKNHMEVTSVTL